MQISRTALSCSLRLSASLLANLQPEDLSSDVGLNDGGFHEPRDEGDVARKPVELGDDELRLVLLAGGEAATNCGRPLRLPLSTSTNSAANFRLPPLR
jgi:hypothetical protein